MLTTFSPVELTGKNRRCSRGRTRNKTTNRCVKNETIKKKGVRLNNRKMSSPNNIYQNIISNIPSEIGDDKKPLHVSVYSSKIEKYPENIAHIKESININGKKINIDKYKKINTDEEKEQELQEEQEKSVNEEMKRTNRINTPEISTFNYSTKIPDIFPISLSNFMENTNIPTNLVSNINTSSPNISYYERPILDAETGEEISVRNQNELQYVFKYPNTKMYNKVVNDIIMKPFNSQNHKHKRIRENFMQYLKKIMRPIASNDRSDKHVYTLMHKWLNRYYYPEVGYPDVESNARSSTRVDDIAYILNQIGYNPSNLVDIGCSEGGITQLVGKKLGLSTVYGVDIIDETELKKVKGTNVELIYIKTSPETIKLDFDTNTVDFVIALMSLHHIKHYMEYIYEIGRMLKTGGILIIQEHNPMDNADKIAIDILHGMYTMVWAKTGEQEDATFNETYEAHYKSSDEWTALLASAGLQKIEINAPIKWKAIPRNNIHNNYWATYIKK